MTEPLTTTTDARPTADELFTNRLYAGMTGSGKSTTIGRDIRTLLEADEDYHVIDITRIPHDRKALDNCSVSFAEFLLREDTDIDLLTTIDQFPYFRVNAEWLTIGEVRGAVKSVFEQALDVAKESDRQVVIVLDDLPGFDLPGVEKYLDKARSYGAVVWAADQYPFESETASLWSDLGEIILHSRPIDQRGEAAATLSEADLSHVSTPAHRGNGSNPVLVGTPGQWERTHVTMTE